MFGRNYGQIVLMDSVAVAVGFAPPGCWNGTFVNSDEGRGVFGMTQ